jgi:hypothetical protein
MHKQQVIHRLEQVLWLDALPDANRPRVAFYDTPNRGRIQWIYSPVMFAKSAKLMLCLKVENVKVEKRGMIVDEDLNKLKLKREDAQDREGWRRYIMGNRVTHASMDRNKTYIK